jgi:hypothetical protein
MSNVGGAPRPRSGEGDAGPRWWTRNASNGRGVSPWTRPPAVPEEYRLLARLSDMLHGWRDGRNHVPLLVVAERGDSDESADHAAGAPPGGEAGRSAGTHDVPGDPAGVPSAFVLPAWIETPRMHVLTRQALGRIKGEQIRFYEERAVLLSEYRNFRSIQANAADKVAEAKEKLDKARCQPSDGELSGRRLAEHDAAERSDALVRSRRRNEWERRLAVAERAYQAVSAEYTQATEAAQLREDLIRDRLAVARAAAQRHYEFAMRRIATYLQQLVRTHERGGDLNVLIGQLIGPELPKWVTSADDSFLWSEAGGT